MYAARSHVACTHFAFDLPPLACTVIERLQEHRRRQEQRRAIIEAQLDRLRLTQH